MAYNGEVNVTDSRSCAQDERLMMIGAAWGLGAAAVWIVAGTVLAVVILHSAQPLLAGAFALLGISLQSWMRWSSYRSDLKGKKDA